VTLDIDQACPYNWGREEEIEMDHWKIEEMVPKKFH